MNKHILTLLVLVTIIFSGCNSQKKITYFQDTNNGSVNTVEHNNTIILKPDDKISIIVNGSQPELSAMFNLPIVTRQISGVNGNTLSPNQNVSGYTLDRQGDIDFPVLGKIHIAGLTREQVATTIKTALADGQLNNAVVTVEYLNLKVSILGEVNRPGTILIDRDKISLLDAISIAGDLTINGVRENISVIRQQTDGSTKSYTVNLLDAENLYRSPVFYLQQNDVIYIHPNPMRARQSTVNGNNVLSASFWVSIASLAMSVALLIKNLK
jgi:polysaccharide export outer membrane protein